MAPQTAAEAIFRLHLDAPYPSLAKKLKPALFRRIQRFLVALTGGDGQAIAFSLLLALCWPVFLDKP